MRTAFLGFGHLLEDSQAHVYHGRWNSMVYGGLPPASHSPQSLSGLIVEQPEGSDDQEFQTAGGHDSMAHVWRLYRSCLLFT